MYQPIRKGCASKPKGSRRDARAADMAPNSTLEEEADSGEIAMATGINGGRRSDKK